jgi:hypothetical protein
MGDPDSGYSTNYTINPIELSKGADLYFITEGVAPLDDTSNIYFCNQFKSPIWRIGSGSNATNALIAPLFDAASGSLLMGSSAFRWTSISMTASGNVSLFSDAGANESRLVLSDENAFLASIYGLNSMFFYVDALNNRYLFTGSARIAFDTDNQVDIGDSTNRVRDIFVAGDITLADAGTIGLGSGKAQLEFNDLAQDDIRLLNGWMTIGTDIAPDTILHIHKATAGAVSAPSGAVLTIESDVSAFLSFLTPNNQSAGLIFGDPDDNDVAKIIHNHSTGNIAITNAGATSFLLNTNKLTQYGAAGEISRYAYQDDALADDATVTLPDAVDGSGWVQAGNEKTHFQAKADGTVILSGSTSLTAAADTDGYLCVYDGGTAAVVKNRLGSAQVVRIVFEYQ